MKAIKTKLSEVKLNPSSADISITSKVKEAMKLFDVAVLDHIILTADSFYSFANNGLM
jgi:DNA repair protein RadC